jgi:hypothetical protein
MLPVRCPDRDQLAGFCAGTLPEQAIERLSEHFEACTQCQESLETLDGLPDPLLAWLQRGSSAPTVARGDLNPLLDRAAGISLAPGKKPRLTHRCPLLG